MTRRLHSLALFVAAVAASACHRAAPVDGDEAAVPRIPRDAARFEIEAVDDSTAQFRPFEARWVKPGMTVYAVDPARRDALVARLRVLNADSGRMRALVTSQVTRVTAEHFILAVPPVQRWYRSRRFWTGAAAGSLVGAAAATVAR